MPIEKYMHDFFDFNFTTTIITPDEEADFAEITDDSVNLPLCSARQTSADTFVTSSRMAELPHSTFEFENPIDNLMFLRSELEEQRGFFPYDMNKPLLVIMSVC